MAIRENTLWTWLRKARLELREHLHMCRIENSCSRGMPDVEGCLDGRQFWLEQKSVQAPKDPALPLRIEFQPGQVEWTNRRLAAGGHAGYLIKVSGGKAPPRIYVVHGKYGDALERGVKESELALLGMQVKRQIAAIAEVLTFVEETA